MLNSTARIAEASDSAPLKQALQRQNTAETVKNTGIRGETVSKERLNAAVEELNKAMETIRTERRFEIDEELDRPIVKVVNSETKEIIRQIPSEEAVKISKNIGEMIGLLMDDRI